jgi:hypothetical protein
MITRATKAHKDSLRAAGFAFYPGAQRGNQTERYRQRLVDQQNHQQLRDRHRLGRRPAAQKCAQRGAKRSQPTRKTTQQGSNQQESNQGRDQYLLPVDQGGRYTLCIRLFSIRVCQPAKFVQHSLQEKATARINNPCQIAGPPRSASPKKTPAQTARPAASMPSASKPKLIAGIGPPARRETATIPGSRARPNAMIKAAGRPSLSLKKYGQGKATRPPEPATAGPAHRCCRTRQTAAR